MLVAVFGDVHAHAEALDAVLAAADVHGAEELWSLGDMIGGGPDPAYVVARTRERCRVALMGNHDYVATGAVDPERLGPAKASLELACAQLTEDDVEWMRKRRPAARRHGVQCWHGGPRDPVWQFVGPRNAADCLAAQREPLGLVAHTHVAAAFQEGTRRPHPIVPGVAARADRQVAAQPGRRSAAAPARAGCCSTSTRAPPPGYRAPYDPAPANRPRPRARDRVIEFFTVASERGRGVPRRLGGRAARRHAAPRAARRRAAAVREPDRRARGRRAVDRAVRGPRDHSPGLPRHTRGRWAHDRPLVEPADVRADRLEAQRRAVRASGNSARSVVPTPTGLMRSRCPRSASTRSRSPTSPASPNRTTAPPPTPHTRAACCEISSNTSSGAAPRATSTATSRSAASSSLKIAEGRSASSARTTPGIRARDVTVLRA